jgi:GNAT superfamily N-acetyltransferase
MKIPRSPPGPSLESTLFKVASFPQRVNMGPQSGGVVRTIVHTAAEKDLDLLVRHRRLMWEAIADFSIRDHNTADAVYRRWARDRMRSRRFAGFIVEVGGEQVASGCVWIMAVQPRPGRSGTAAAYLLSMFTEPDHRGEGHATRIVRAAIRWASSRGIPIMLLHASDCGEPIYRRLGFERTREMRRSLVRASRRKPRSSRKTSRRATH